MQHSRHHGFTLVEMLVALALMGMISIILVTSLQIGGHTWQRVMRSASNTDEIAQAQETLRHRLRTAYPESRMAVSETVQPPLLSNGTSLEFLGEAPEATGGGILHYRIAVSPNSGELQISARPDGATQPSQSNTESLLLHVKSLAIQFWLKSEANPGRWVDRWNSNHLPGLIRIDVSFADADKRRWPPLYIEPRTDTPVSCVFDVVSRRCRSGA